MEQNPALPHVEQLLTNNSKHWREYEIIYILDSLPSQQFEWPFNIDRGELTLFKKHFLTMNALYQLKAKFRPQGWHLTISAVDIVLTKTPLDNATTNLTEGDLISITDQPLATFYLDWDHYYSASTDSVNTLLTQFWERYIALQHQTEAYDILGLKPPANRREIENRYRQLASRFHPDKGGEHEKFIEIRQAYEKLIKITG